MNVLGVGAPAPASLSSSALHFRLKVTNILPPSPIYHSRTVYIRETSHNDSRVSCLDPRGARLSRLHTKHLVKGLWRPRHQISPGGTLATEVRYFGVKSANVTTWADGHLTC